jgi:hypothetical protein
MSNEYEDQIIDEFMGDNGRAAEWRAMRESLQDRLRALRAERASTTLPDAISSLDRRIAQIAEQVAVLETEEAVSTFVEDSVRATLRGGVRRPNFEDEE